jgi:hypothetical protein
MSAQQKKQQTFVRKPLPGAQEQNFTGSFSDSPSLASSASFFCSAARVAET